MACNTCSKSFSLFRSEKGCPGCGFSYCSKCLNNKVFLEKLNSEAMVCVKCKQSMISKNQNKIEPPDAYYKRIGTADGSVSGGSTEKEISERLRKLKEDKQVSMAKVNDKDITDRLQKIKGEKPSTSDADLRSRLANLKGLPVYAVENKIPVISGNRFKTEQEEVDNLMRQFMEQGNIDKQYEEKFDGVVNNIEARLQKLKGHSESVKVSPQADNCSSEDEDETIKKIIEKVKAEAKLESEDNKPGMDELPFCEICNEDAKMRCLGCKYLYCKRCFKDHEDSDDGCDKFEPYSPPKHIDM